MTDNVEIMLILLAIVMTGFVAGKLGYMGGDFDKRLSNIVIDITCPALILSSTMGGQLPAREMIVPLLAISLLTYIVLTAVAFVLPRFLTSRTDDEGVIGFALMFGNVGFIGYPIVASIFGHEAVFYAAVLNVVNTFAVFTVGTTLVVGKNGNSTFHPKVLYSTPMVAAYLAMLIVALQIDDIPRLVSGPLTMVGNITVPAALLIIGSSMSQLSLRTMLGNREVYVTSFCRLVAIPLALYALCRILGFSSYVVNLNTVIIAMPVATYGTILCLKHNRDAALITEVTFITTLLSVVTIPVITTIMSMLE